MAEIKLIMLDFDGTLVDTRKANARAYIETLGERGIVLSEQEYLKRFFGVRCIEFMQMVGISDPEEIRRLRRRKVELYPKYFDSVVLNEALWGWCQMMRYMGAKVWIVSTGHIDNLRNVISYLNIADGIDGIISGDDVERPKPNPDCFLEAMRREGVTPAESIIFEDSEVGIEAARRSGAAYSVIKL
ncbi:MAG: HAD-IA family hydrolase [Alistipes sp.]|nr:HAD-IA family hydrolase [Alistipes sp.]